MGTDGERALRGMLRTGTVASVNVANNTARVKFDDKDGIASPEGTIAEQGAKCLIRLVLPLPALQDRSAGK